MKYSNFSAVSLAKEAWLLFLPQWWGTFACDDAIDFFWLKDPNWPGGASPPTGAEGSSFHLAPEAAGICLGSEVKMCPAHHTGCRLRLLWEKGWEESEISCLRTTNVDNSKSPAHL